MSHCLNFDERKWEENLLNQKQNSEKLNILFQLSGSISCYKSCFLISRLVQQGHNVKVVATPSALKFVGPQTLEGLTGFPVFSDLFKESSAMDHIHLISWSDLFVLCPASAHTLNALACGLTENLIGALFLALDFKKPYLVFPSMNSRMFSHPTTQASLSSLKSWGIEVFETAYGSLACGEEGWGRLLDLDVIEKKIQEQISIVLKKKSLQKKEFQKKERDLKSLPHILVTAGGTQESIDSVRFLSNLSSGVTGAKIAESLVLNGFRVTYLHSVSSSFPFSNLSKKEELKKCIHFFPFRSFKDFKAQFQTLLKKEFFDAVIHSAALSDFSIQSIQQGKETFLPSQNGKYSSEKGDLVLHLKKNEKLLYKIKSLSKNTSCYVFAFKLTYEKEEVFKKNGIPKGLKKMLQKKDLDFVIHNDLWEIEREIKKRKNPQSVQEKRLDFHIFRLFKFQSDSSPSLFLSKEELAQNLSSLLLELLQKKRETEQDKKLKLSSSKRSSFRKG